MPDAIWIERNEQQAELAAALAEQPWFGLDTEFMRERTFFPRLCLLQIAIGGRIWCVDTLGGNNLQVLTPAFTAPATRKIIHSARQDLEAIYLHSRRVVAPVFDTQIVAGCIGMKPQIGYAELAQLLLGVTVAKGQTRSDWSRRPLSAAQVQYAAEDVLHLGEIAERLMHRLVALGREAWAQQDCEALSDPSLYDADPARAWERVRGLAQLQPHPRERARALAIWREREARARDLPRAWILSDAAMFDAAHLNPTTGQELQQALHPPDDFPAALAEGLLETLREASRRDPSDMAPGKDARLTAEQKMMLEKLSRRLDARAKELGINAEILAPRAELKAMAQGERLTACQQGWRRDVIGAELMSML